MKGRPYYMKHKTKWTAWLNPVEAENAEATMGRKGIYSDGEQMKMDGSLSAIMEGARKRR